MTIGANHLTLGRIALLPLPLAMLYHGGAAWSVAALLTLIALGLTDIFDGWLARRKPPTRLGHVLDGISDRVFVAVLYTVLCDLHIIPIAVLALIIARELFVVALRGIATETAAVGRAGRLKMTVQMVGAGFLLVMWLVPAPWIHVVLAVSAVVSGALLLRHPDWRAAWWTGLTLALMAVRFALPARSAMAVLTAIILSITLISGVMFAWSVRDETLAKLRHKPAVVFGLIVVTLATPVLWIPLIGVDRFLAVVVAGVCAGELTLLSLRAAALDGRPAAWISSAVAVTGLVTQVLLMRHVETGTIRWFAGSALMLVLAVTVSRSVRALCALASTERTPGQRDAVIKRWRSA